MVVDVREEEEVVCNEEGEDEEGEGWEEWKGREGREEG